MLRALRILMGNVQCHTLPFPTPPDTEFPARLRTVAERVEARLDDLLPKPTGHQAVIMEAARYAALGGGSVCGPF